MVELWDKMAALQELLNACQTCEITRRKEMATVVCEIVEKHQLDLNEPYRLVPPGSALNPLFEACRSGNIHIIKVFIDSGAQLNVLDSEGRSPLYVAISSHHNSCEIIAQLLHWGADVNFHSHNHCPLLAAFYCTKRETAKLLILHGADVNNVILPAFCYVESVFTLNSNLVMMASGVRFQLTSFKQLTSLGYDILHAGLHPRSFFISGRRFLFEGFTPDELTALWKFQHICLILGFKVDRVSLRGAISEMQAIILAETDKDRVSWMNRRIEKLIWMQTFLSQPMPLTYLARCAIRSHLVSPKIRSCQHLNLKIDSLPVPKVCQDFLTLRHCDIKDIVEYLKV